MIVLNRLPKIIAELPVVVDAALKGGAERVAESARDRAPDAPPMGEGLVEAIHVEKVPEGYSIVAGDENVYWGGFQEFGTVRHAAQPFLIPALEEERDVVTGGVVTVLRKL